MEKKVSMVDICYQMQGRCMVHSALDIWDNNIDKLRQDIDVSGTILNHIKRTSTQSGLSLHPATLFGNATLDVLGQPISADSVLVTFLLREGPQRQKYREEWNSIWNTVTADQYIQPIESFNVKPSTPFFTRPDVEIEHFQYKYNSESIPLDSEIWILLITYSIIFVIVAVAFGNVQLVKSKYGLALAAVFETVACLSATLGIFTLANLSFAHVPLYMIPLVVIVATIENVFVLTNATLHSGCDMPIKEKVGRGLEALGFSITATLLAELSILAIGTGTGLQAVKEFCQFTAIALVIDYMLQLTFFVSVLSVDIRRVELTDLDNRTLAKRVHLTNSEMEDIESDGEDANEFCPVEKTEGGRPNCAVCKDFKTHRAVTALVICSCILMLSVFSSKTSSFDQSSVSLEQYAQMESISTNFWNVVNPSYGVRFIEVRSPILVALDASEETFEHLQQINNVYESASAAKRAYERELQNQSITQRFGFQLIHRLVAAILSINIPSVLILMTLIGIILWMLPPYREGFLEPMFQSILARYGKYLVLAYISSKIPWAPLQRALKASQAAEYDKDGNHRGAISLQQNVSKRQITALGDVRIVTLSGHHAGDIQSLDCSSSHGTIVSVGREGELVLWDGIRGKWVARLDRVQRRHDAKSFNGDVNPEYTVGGSPIGTRLGGGPGRKIAVPSPIKCIKIDYSNQWIACGHGNGLIRIWSISSSSWVRELTSTHKTNDLNSKLNGLPDIEIVSEEMNSTTTDRKAKPATDMAVVALAFIGSSTAQDYSVTDLPKLARKYPSGRSMNPSTAPTYLIAAYADGYIREWQVDSGECVNTVEIETKNCTSHLLVAPVKSKSVHERQRVFTVSKDGTVTCYGRRNNDTEDFILKPTWRSLYTIKGHCDQAISSISADTSADGTGIFVIGSEKGSVQVWNISNGNHLCTLAEGQKQRRADNNSKISARMPTRHESNPSQFRMSSNDHDHSYWYQDSDHYSAVQQIAISRVCRSELSTRLGKVDQCHRNEFLIASSSKDGMVNIWKVTYSAGSTTEKCEQCGFGSKSAVYSHKRSSSSYSSTGQSNTPQPQPQPNGARREPVISRSSQSLAPVDSTTDQLTANETSEDPFQDGVIDIEQLAANLVDFHVTKSYLGSVCQPGGYGITWLKNSILAGVRRNGVSGNGSKKLDWELWMAPMRKHELHRRQRQNESSSDSSFPDPSSKSNISVISVKLNNDTEDIPAPEADDLGFISRLLSSILSSTIPARPHRPRQLFISKARRMSVVNTARLPKNRRKNRNSALLSSKVESEAMVKEELSTKELLPFINVTCMQSLDGDGLAFDFGNFVKVVWLDEQLPLFTLSEKDHNLESDNIHTNGLRPRYASKEKPLMAEPKVDVDTEDRQLSYLRRRSSSFSDISKLRLPCGVPRDAARCQTPSCEANCSYKRTPPVPTATNAATSKKLN